MSSNKEIVVVMHAHRIWKDTYFESVDQALGSVRMANPRMAFKKENGRKLVAVDTGATYIAKELKAYENLTKLIDDRIF